MSAGIPGLRRLDHFGFTVPDFAQAREFLEEVLGCSYLYSNGPFKDSTGEWMLQNLGVHPRAVMQKLHFFELTNQAIFEVFEYASPDQSTAHPRNSDVGGHHVALYVEDLDTAVQYLHEHGVEVLGEPKVSSGPNLGQRWIYFRAPWGMYFELVSYPNGKAYFSS
ncbi:MAG: VOC family protein [Leucobacter sp.]